MSANSLARSPLDALDSAKRLHRCGQLAAAEALYRGILCAAPQSAQALSGLGVCLAQSGRLREAIAILELAVAYSPNAQAAAPCLANLGNALQEAGQREEALRAFDRALVSMPGNVDLLVNRANALRLLGRNQEALASYDSALQRLAGHARARIGRGVLLSMSGQSEQALADFEVAAQAEPHNPVAHYNRGVALKALERFEASAEAFAQTLQLQPDNPDAHFNLGLVHKALGRPQAALAAIGQAIARRGDFAQAHASRGHLLQELGDYAGALQSYDVSLAHAPEQAGILLTRADALRNLGRYAQAARDYERALTLDPDHPDCAKAHVNWATCCLLLGEFADGWEQFEWRWGDPTIHPPYRHRLDRLWLGKQDPAGRTVLLHAEQGYGDTLQFCRYAPLLARRGARVLLEIPKALHPLLQSLDGVSGLLAPGDAEPQFDWHTPLLSLPLAFGTGLDSVPAQVPYLQPAQSRVRTWQQRLGTTSKRRIGLAWSGNPAHGNDAHRSIALDLFAALLRSPTGCQLEWVSLQREIRAGDQGAVDRLGVRDFRGQLGDFADTAALVHQLDLVICVDTSVAHLAGALGRPTWILLPFVPDWRWMLDRTDSPWYPSARLFRQRAPGDWPGVLRNVEAALGALLSSRPAALAATA